jgi:hypothetical protein
MALTVVTAMLAVKAVLLVEPDLIAVVPDVCALDIDHVVLVTSLL